MTRDPIKDGRNWFAYCENNPLALVDPDGQLPFLLGAALVAGLIAASATDAVAPEYRGQRVRPMSVWERLDVAMLAASPFVGTGALRAMLALRPAAQPATGQHHHVLSKKVMDALSRHPLRGKFNRNDPRFIMRATNKQAHQGYQNWHREHDDKIVNWLKSRPGATPRQFEAFLRKLYREPDMRKRFPGGPKW